MNCPVDHARMHRVELEAGLPAFTCDSCAGHWFRFGDYLTWRERQPGNVPEVPPEAGGELAVASDGRVRRCPDCDHLLARHRVGHGVPFALDRCGGCHGVWFDRAEWETLRARGLHDDVHQMFGPGWQFAARAEDRRQRVEAQFQRQLGTDYDRTREFAAWVAAHPRRSEILAYVQSTVRQA